MLGVMEEEEGVDTKPLCGPSREDKILQKECGQTKLRLIGGMACAAKFLLC